MILSDADHETLIRSLAGVFPNGHTQQRARDLALTVIGSVSNAFRNAGFKTRLGVDSDLRTLTALNIFSGGTVYTVPLLLMGGVLTLGTVRVSLDKPESAAALVNALFRAVETAVRNA
jgi:hypothetical protein